MRARGTDSAKVIQVIETQAMRGDGTEKDPVRGIVQYWDLGGNFLAEMDPYGCPYGQSEDAVNEVAERLSEAITRHL